MFLFLLAALFAMAIVTQTLAARRLVFQGNYFFTSSNKEEASFVSKQFELTGRPSSVEISIRTDLNNNWAYLNLALINAVTGDSYDFGREVSYYYGSDSDGSWSEGGRNDSALIPSVPAGQYYLRVEPEMDANAAPVNYSIELRRDVPAVSFFWIAALLLLIPPIFGTFRSAAFESRRWSESDYAP
jgi:hypothetical protein